MPHIKNALFRYRIIDRALRNEFAPFPSKIKLRELCEEALYGANYGDHICDSTIEKDLFAMRNEHDAPIQYSKKERGYYYGDKHFSLDEVPLNNSDIEAIRFAANTLSQFKDVSVFKQFGYAIDKIVQSVSKEVMQGSDDSVVEFEQAISSRGSEFIPIILNAINSKTMLFFDYESFQSQQRKPRKVGPYLLKEYRNRWYMLCFDVVKNAITNYALDRIFDLKDSEERFVSPISFDSKKFFKYSTGITASDSPPQIVQLKANEIAARYIESQPFHHSQRVYKKLPTGETIFEMEVYLTEDFYRLLLAYSNEITVIKPDLLISILKERAKGVLNNYSE